jgi:signal transduction histidine kinase
VRNKLSNLSLSLRLALLFTLTFTVGLALAFFIAYWQLSNSLEKSSKEVISSKLIETSALLHTGGIPGLTEFLSSEKNKILNAPFMVRVLAEDGKSLYTKPSVQAKNFDFASDFGKADPPKTFLGWHALSAINDEDKFDILTAQAGSGLYIQIGKSSEDREEILEDLLGIFAVTGVGLILISGALGIWYARKSLSPIRGLLTTIKKIENGNLSERVASGNSNDELQDLSQTFNRMIARIEKLVQVMRESLDNVAHEIRTPLTRIRAVAEDSLLTGTPASIKVALEDCAEGAEDISELVDQLMSITEAEIGALKLKYESCDLKLLLEDVVDIYELVAEEKRITIKISVPERGLTWPLDRKRIKQVVGNLLDNAIKFSPAGSSIEISAARHGEKLEFSVKDQGCGIAEPDLEKIWDRLFRGDRSRTTSGLGLGLSIVRAIVIAHSGEINAVSEVNGGMNFSVSLPFSGPAL